MSLDTTVGGANAESYGTADRALTYFQRTGRDAQWQALITVQGDEALLLRSMMFIEEQPYIGERANVDEDNPQALEFPRRATYARGIDPDLAGDTWTDLRGRVWTSAAVPTPIENAQYEQALAIGKDPTYTDDGLLEKEIRTNQGRLKFKTGSDNAGGLCVEAGKLLSPFLRGSGQSGRSYR